MKVQSNSEDGFSLVEVLVVLAVVSVLAASLALTSSQFGKLLRADRQAASRLALQQTVHHVVELLEQVEDIPILTPTDREPIRNGLLGKPQEARFVAITRRGALVQGLREITLRTEGGVLVQSMTPRRSETQAVERIELANDVDELSFSYFGMQGETLTPSWYREWLKIETLPLAIAVRLTVREGSDLLTATDVATLNR